jgi:hypothetical protein
MCVCVCWRAFGGEKKNRHITTPLAPAARDETCQQAGTNVLRRRMTAGARARSTVDLKDDEPGLVPRRQTSHDRFPVIAAAEAQLAGSLLNRGVTGMCELK